MSLRIIHTEDQNFIGPFVSEADAQEYIRQAGLESNNPLVKVLTPGTLN